MKRSPSQYSAVMIGVHEEQYNPAREMFMQEAKQVSNMLNGVHHLRKQSHDQVFYPETVEKLSQLQAERTQALRMQNSLSSFPSQTLTSTQYDDKAKVKEFKQTRMKDYEREMTQHILQERMINYRKKEYFRENGRKAIVNQVISGTAPLKKESLFPLTASHEQILAITNTLKAPNPNIIPPEVPRQRKFNPDKGWS